MNDLDYVKKMASVFTEIEMLEDDIKAIKEEAKEKGYDPTLLAQVAKASVKLKLDVLKDKSINLIKLIESL